jgi:hypothetical protein
MVTVASAITQSLMEESSYTTTAATTSEAKPNRCPHLRHKGPVALWRLLDCLCVCLLFEQLKKLVGLGHLEHRLAEFQRVGLTTREVDALHAVGVFVNPFDIHKLTHRGFFGNVEHALTVWITLSS